MTSIEDICKSIMDMSFEIAVLYGHLLRVDLSRIPADETFEIHKACNRLNLYSRAIDVKVRREFQESC